MIEFNTNLSISKTESQILSEIEDVQSRNIIFQNIIFDVDTMKDAKGNIFVRKKTGRWIPQDCNKTSGNRTTCVYYYPVCSECGHTGDFDMNYCPNCGADMRGESDG